MASQARLNLACLLRPLPRLHFRSSHVNRDAD